MLIRTMNYKCFVGFAIVLLWIVGIVIRFDNADLATAQNQNNTISRAPSADTFVASGRPNESRGERTTIWVGYSRSQSFNIQRTLLKFDLTDVPMNSMITSAKLSLYMDGTTTNDSPMNVEAIRILSNWSEDITWASHVNLTLGEQTATTVVGTEFGWYEWNVQNLVQSWANDPNRLSDVSILLKGFEGGGQRERGFWSKDCDSASCSSRYPKLEIVFETPTPIPTETPIPTATHTPTNTPVPPTATATPTATPVPGLILHLENEPNDATQIRRGDEITYTLSYRFNETALGSDTTVLSKVVITNVIPLYTEVISESYTCDDSQCILQWTLDDLTRESSFEPIIYRVKKPGLDVEASSGERLFIEQGTPIEFEATSPGYDEFSWFVAGQPKTGQSVAFSIEQSGLYSLTVQALQDESIIQTALISPLIVYEPIENIALDGESNGNPLIQTLTLESSDSITNTGILCYEWNWDDGSPQEMGLLETPRSHIYETEGQYRLAITATDISQTVFTSTRILTLEDENKVEVRLDEAIAIPEYVSSIDAQAYSSCDQLIEEEFLPDIRHEETQSPTIINLGAFASWEYSDGQGQQPASSMSNSTLNPLVTILYLPVIMK